MLLELLIAGQLQTYTPQPEPEVRQETETVQIIDIEEVAEVPPELTLKEKIKSNYYKCNTDTHYIRADNAKCLAKPVYTSYAKKRSTGRQNSSRAYSGYYYQCAGWVASKRYVPAGWGNASNWRSAAQRAGWTISGRPVAGAIGWRGNHVVYVERVNGNGTVRISERNYDWKNSIRTITVPISKYTYLY